MKRILVRIDDVCPTMNFEMFKIAMNIMDEYNIKPLLGVIPDCRDQDLQIEAIHDDFWLFIKRLQNKGYTIAMHGYAHTFDNKARGIVVKRCDSEFAGLPYEVQLEKIIKGRKLLESNGIYTDIFFAPGHSYDENTLKALSACGFNFISDGLSVKPYKLHGIRCIPARSAGMPRLLCGTNHTAIFHVHEWIREEKKYCYNQFVNLITTHYKEIVTWDEYINVPNGNIFIQRTIEKLHVFFNRYIRTFISKIICIIKNI